MVILDLHERWIPGYEGKYSAKTSGEIITYHTHFKTPRPLKTIVNNKGYIQVSLVGDRRTRTYRIHRLLAMTFLTFDKNLDVNHIDGNKLNNNLNNLEMVSRKENIRHAFKLGLRCEKGENHNRTHLKNSDIREIRDLWYHRLFTQVKLGELYGIGDTTISKIVTRNTWSHIW